VQYTKTSVGIQKTKEEQAMSIEKKSLISNRTASKKAIATKADINQVSSTKLSAPKLGHGVSPKLGHGVTPKLGHGVTPKLGHGVTPKLGHGVTPKLGHGVTPKLGHGVTPKLGGMTNARIKM
jgi:hypothetical protein